MIKVVKAYKVDEIRKKQIVEKKIIKNEYNENEKD